MPNKTAAVLFRVLLCSPYGHKSADNGMCHVRLQLLAADCQAVCHRQPTLASSCADWHSLRFGFTTLISPPTTCTQHSTVHTGTTATAFTNSVIRNFTSNYLPRKSQIKKRFRNSRDDLKPNWKTCSMQLTRPFSPHSKLVKLPRYTTRNNVATSPTSWIRLWYSQICAEKGR